MGALGSLSDSQQAGRGAHAASLLPPGPGGLGPPSSGPLTWACVRNSVNWTALGAWPHAELPRPRSLAGVLSASASVTPATSPSVFLFPNNYL